MAFFMDQREKAMDANAITRAYFDEILIEMRHIDNKIPDTTLHLYGETFSTPIMMAWIWIIPSAATASPTSCSA